MEIPVGYAQANFLMSGVGLPLGAECTLGIDISEFGGTPDEAAENLAAFWQGAFRDEQSSAIQFDGVRIKYGPNDTGPTGEYIGPVSGNGASTGVTPAVSVMVKKVTAFGGKAGRGRMFVPGLVEGAVTAAGLIDTSPLAAWQAEADEFFDACVAIDLPPVLLHGEGSPLVVPSPVLSLVVDPRVATQRRRNRR